MAIASAGRFSIDDEGNGFELHASYGYGPVRRALREMKIGDYFVFKGVRYQLTTLSAANGATGHAADDATLPDFRGGLDDQVDLPDQTETVNEPLGQFWRDNAHPHFLDRDLPDLIAVLRAYKQAKGL